MSAHEKDRVVLTRLRTVAQLAAESGEIFTEMSLRWLLFHRDSNGLAASGAVVRIGRRLFIDLDRFEEWLASNRGTKLR